MGKHDSDNKEHKREDFTDIESLLKQKRNEPVPESVLKSFEGSVMSEISGLPAPERAPGMGIPVLAGACLLIGVFSLGYFGYRTLAVKVPAAPAAEVAAPVSEPNAEKNLKELIDQLPLHEKLRLVEDVDVQAKEFVIDLIGKENYALTEFSIVQPYVTAPSSPAF